MVLVAEREAGKVMPMPVPKLALAMVGTRRLEASIIDINSWRIRNHPPDVIYS